VTGFRTLQFKKQDVEGAMPYESEHSSYVFLIYSGSSITERHLILIIMIFLSMGSGRIVLEVKQRHQLKVL